MSQSTHACGLMAMQKKLRSFTARCFRILRLSTKNPMVVIFKAAGQKFMCLNGGPAFKFTPAISFYTIILNEDEIQTVWDILIENGRALMPLDRYPWSKKYGWVQDKFGVTWQLTIDKPEFSDQKFIPAFLFSWNNFGKAEEAINFYSSIFEGSSIKLISRYEAGDANGQDGKINHAQFELNGQLFAAMGSAIVHDFDFNEALSLVVECADQTQIDYFWEKFLEGGKESQCGWLKDRYGISWQIVPEILPELMANPERSGWVVQAFMKMKKFDIEKLANA